MPPTPLTKPRKTRQNARRAIKPAITACTPTVHRNEAGKRIYTLFVPGIPPSLNDRLHWATRARHNATYRDAVAWQVRSVRPHRLGFARVTITLVRRGGRCRDLDNAYASVKGPLDGLVVGGLLVDDSPAHIELLVTQERGPVRGVRLVVEEV